MMKRLLRWLGFLLLALMACAFLQYPDVLSAALKQGLSVCANSILPALFPFFIVSDLWIRLGYAQRIGRLLSPLTRRLFHLPGSAACAILLGCVGGYPVGAKTVAQLYANGHLNRTQAHQCLYFCNNAGPAFVFGVAGAGIFHSVSMGATLYLIHLLSALLIGVILRPAIVQDDRSFPIGRPEPVPQAITQSIVQGGRTALQVCTYVLFFSVLTGCIRPLLPETGWSCLLLGAMELAGGANLLSALSCSPELKLLAASTLLGWGGLCVLLQSISLLQEAGLEGKTLLKGKLLHGGLSLFLTLLVTKLISLPVPCLFMNRSKNLPSAVGQWLLAGVVFLLTLIFVKKTSGKTTHDSV